MDYYLVRGKKSKLNLINSLQIFSILFPPPSLWPCPLLKKHRGFIKLLRYCFSLANDFLYFYEKMTPGNAKSYSSKNRNDLLLYIFCHVTFSDISYCQKPLFYVHNIDMSWGGPWEILKIKWSLASSSPW